MRVIIIYDDTGRKSEVISDIIGEKGFSDVVVKRRKLEEYYKEAVCRIFPDLIWKKIHSTFEYSDLVKELEAYYSEDVKIVHCFSNYLIADASKALLSFRKIAYVDLQYAMLSEKRAVAGVFPSAREYISFLRLVLSGQKPWDLIRNSKHFFEIEGMIDISIVSNFIQCITGNFDSRYFNTLKENEYTLVKSSANKKKIKAEYTFFHLLPEDMKYWFVMPFNYCESEDSASYTMERLHMTDLAIKWVHGSMEIAEFEELLDKYFFFFKSRHWKECSKEDYLRISNDLYVHKVKDRIAKLKEHEEYKKFARLLSGTDFDIDLLMNRYFELKKIIEARTDYPNRLVIGHGDPCFANALYNKSTQTLKFIDPKGAIKESDLWTNPYYDVAKLSHSVCGRYDFFNNGLFDIKISPNFLYELEIPFDNRIYIHVFKQKLEENGYDYLTVRIYEASLFLSMLPLHIDNPHKVFGFILNVKNILDEVEVDV